jgi:hypothetical protein
MMWAVLTLAPQACHAATGDISFRAADRFVHFIPANPLSAIEVFLEVEGVAGVPASGWGMVVNITPQPGSSGTVTFNPPTIINNQPNLMPTSQNPFLDFDRDFNGKSYGMLGQSATELRAFGHYIAPTLGPAPTLDANGNLMFPAGTGLVSLPVVLSADAAGDFLVTFNPDPVVTGVVRQTGLPSPHDVAVHPTGAHLAGVLSVVNPAGDYNGNRSVDAADYVVWRKNDGTQEGYDAWRARFGQTMGAESSRGSIIPEPSNSLLLLLAWFLTMRCRIAAPNAKGNSVG